MKRFVTGMVALSMLLGLTACGASGSQSAPAQSATQAQTEASAETSDSADTEQADTPSGDPLMLKLGTGGSSGVFYYLGAAIQDSVNGNLSTIEIACESTSASVENTRRVSAGDLDLGFTSPNTIVTECRDGNASAENIMLLGCNYPNLWYVVGRTDMPENLEEAITAGLHIGAGEPGSSLQQQMSDVLSVLDLTLDDMESEQIGQGEMVDALIDNRIKAGIFGGPVPYATVQQIEAQISGGIHIFNWSDEQIQKLHDTKDPFVSGITIPAGTYEGTDYDTTIPGWTIPIIVNASVDEDAVYELTKYLYTHAEDLEKIYNQGATFTLDNALVCLDSYEANGIYLHPGAERYYKEVGLID